jgi:hypothetical protein
MRHTKRIDNYATQLATAAELPEDYLIGMYTLLQSFGLRLENHFDTEQASPPPKGDAAVHFTTELLLRELDTIKESIGSVVARRGAFLHLRWSNSCSWQTLTDISTRSWT